MPACSDLLGHDLFSHDLVLHYFSEMAAITER